MPDKMWTTRVGHWSNSTRIDFARSSEGNGDSKGLSGRVALALVAEPESRGDPQEVQL